LASLRVLSGREACRILQSHGFSEVRRKVSKFSLDALFDLAAGVGLKVSVGIKRAA